MLKCKLGSARSAKNILQRNLSQRKLYDELASIGTRPDLLPKTYPTEVRRASNPPVVPNKSKDELNRKVLEALSRANDNAMKKGQPILPTLEVWKDTSGTGRAASTVRDDVGGLRREGRALAEQLILKYPESFKIRFSDHMSRPKLSEIEVLCRDKKIEELEEVFSKVLLGMVAPSTSDFEAMIAFFAEHNTSTALTEWPMTVSPWTKTSWYTKTYKEYPDEEGGHNGSTKWLSRTYHVPYSKSLLKTVDVESRNVHLAIEKLINSSEDGIPESMKRYQLKMKFDKKYGEVARLRLGLNSAEYTKQQDKTMVSPNYKGDKGKNRLPDAKALNHSATIPEKKDDLYISVMDQNAICLRLIKEMGAQVTAKAYCSVIRSAVRYYNPELAWKMYKQMREKGFYPDQSTLCDLLYSITHDMLAKDFVETGAKKINQLFSDLKENPERKLTDELFLYSFYGVHRAPAPAQKPASFTGTSELRGSTTNLEDKLEDKLEDRLEDRLEDKLEDGLEDKLEDRPEDRLEDVEDKLEARGSTPKLEVALDKYNYQILEDMTYLMKTGQLKLRFSTAFKMLVMLNLTVADEPKTRFQRDFNTVIYDLAMEQPDAFIRDEIAGTDCSSFLKVLLCLASAEIPHYNPDLFYKAHKDNITALMDYASWNASSNLFFPLDHILATLCKDLNKPKDVEAVGDLTRVMNGPNCDYATIEEMRDVSVWNLYDEIVRPRLSRMPAFQAFRFIRNSFTLLQYLDVQKVEPSYYISRIDALITAVEEIDELCYWPRADPDSADTTAKASISFGWGQSSTDNLYRAVESALHTLQQRYLIGTPVVLPDTANDDELNLLENFQLVPIKLSDEEIHQIISLTTRGIQLIIKHEGIPTVHMAMLLTSKVIESGEFLRGWQVMNMLNTYNISIENDKIWLLSMVQLTPNWDQDGEKYLNVLHEPLQSKVRAIIGEYEEVHNKKIAELVRGPQIKNNPFAQQQTSVGFLNILNNVNRTYSRL